MALIIKPNKPIATRPIKSGQPLGAILGSLGLDRCIPLIHGAQGCSAFAKVFFIQHFHEPVPLQSTAMDPITTIMGSDDNILQALVTLCERSNPRIIVLMSSGLAEAQGADMTRAIKLFRQSYPKHDRIEVVHLNTPDFYGSMENGFATTRYNSKVTIIGLTLLDSEMADMTVSAHREQPETGANYTV